MEINNQVIERATRNVNRILVKNQGKIEEAFDRAEEALMVALSLEFKPKGSGIKIKTGINFVVERAKDSSEDEVYPPDPIALEAERAAAERERRERIGNTAGTWARMRSYRHR